MIRRRPGLAEAREGAKETRVDYALFFASCASSPQGGSTRSSTARITNGSTMMRMAGQQPLARGEAHLVRRVAEQALREELAADDDVPAHREDADERQDARRRRKSAGA